jgi:hypothetical protein
VSNRRTISRDYKERKLQGGVYTVTNTQNGKYVIGYAANLDSIRNRFAFAVRTNSAVHPALRADWAALGAEAFALAVVAELEQPSGQSEAEFLTDLKALEQLCRADLDPAREY